MVATKAGSTAIHSIAKANPQLALLGATIERAVLDAQAGDLSARVWIKSDRCLWMLAAIAPPGLDARCLQQRLLNRLDGKDG